MGLCFGTGTSWVAMVIGVFALVACHDVVTRPDGAACSADAQCRSGWCGGICTTADGDDDGDGLSNALEFARGTALRHTDTDRDGLGDAIEGDRDSDGDGKIDAVESNFADADGDCITDVFDADDANPEADADIVARLSCRSLGPCAASVERSPVIATCSDGVLTCNYAAVIGWEGNEERSCDGIDNDCDGVIDDPFVHVDGLHRPRAIGETCFGTGSCLEQQGVVQCSSDAGRAICSVNEGGSAFAGFSVDIDCDGIDNDCDGLTDEAIVWRDPVDGRLLPVGAPCRAEGVCGLGFGLVECALDGANGQCSSGPGGSDDRSRGETCNGLDDDCDGLRDEGLTWSDPALPAAEPYDLGVGCGVGVCAGGQVVCTGDGGTTCSTASRARAEVCNGLDDDCDGQTDESSDLRGLCPVAGRCGIGALASARCDGAALVCRYGDGFVWTSGAVEARCDGVDDDCDGLVDEDFGLGPGRPQGSVCTGQGACAGAAGTVVCAPDGLRAACSADFSGTAERCNGIDDDCDGRTDVGVSPENDVCQRPGICAEASNGAICRNGAWRCGWEDDPRFEAANEAACDGFDNDCDGFVDEGLLGEPLGLQESVDLHILRRDAAAALVRGPDGIHWLEALAGAPLRWWRFREDVARMERERVGGVAPVFATAPIAVHHPDHQVFVVAADAIDGTGAQPWWVFEPASASWFEVQWQQGPVPRRGAAMAALPDGTLLVMGGTAALSGWLAPERITLGPLRDADNRIVGWRGSAGIADDFDGGPALTDGRIEVVEVGSSGAVVVAVGRAAGDDVGSADVGAVWSLEPDGVRGPWLLQMSEGVLPSRPAITVAVGAADRHQGLAVDVLGAGGVWRWSLGPVTDAIGTSEAVWVAATRDVSICPNGALSRHVQGVADATGAVALEIIGGQCSSDGAWSGANQGFTVESAMGAELRILATSLWQQPLRVIGDTFGPGADGGLVVRTVRTRDSGGVDERVGTWSGDGWSMASVAPDPVAGRPLSARLVAGAEEAGGARPFVEIGPDGLTQWELQPRGASEAVWQRLGTAAANTIPSPITQAFWVGRGAGGDDFWALQTGGDGQPSRVTLVGNGFENLGEFEGRVLTVRVLGDGQAVEIFALENDGQVLGVHTFDATTGDFLSSQQIEMPDDTGIPSLMAATAAHAPVFGLWDDGRWFSVADGVLSPLGEVTPTPDGSAMIWVPGRGPAVIDSSGETLQLLLLGCREQADAD